MSTQTGSKSTYKPAVKTKEQLASDFARCKSPEARTKLFLTITKNPDTPIENRRLVTQIFNEHSKKGDSYFAPESSLSDWAPDFNRRRSSPYAVKGADGKWYNRGGYEVERPEWATGSQSHDPTKVYSQKEVNEIMESRQNPRAARGYLNKVLNNPDTPDATKKRFQKYADDHPDKVMDSVAYDKMSSSPQGSYNSYGRQRSMEPRPSRDVTDPLRYSREDFDDLPQVRKDVYGKALTSTFRENNSRAARMLACSDVKKEYKDETIKVYHDHPELYSPNPKDGQYTYGGRALKGN